MCSGDGEFKQYRNQAGLKSIETEITLYRYLINSIEGGEFDEELEMLRLDLAERRIQAHGHDSGC